jgi:hypothetical protein
MLRVDHSSAEAFRSLLTQVLLENEAPDHASVQLRGKTDFRSHIVAKKGRRKGMALVNWKVK